MAFVGALADVTQGATEAVSVAKELKTAKLAAPTTPTAASDVMVILLARYMASSRQSLISAIRMLLGGREDGRDLSKVE